MSTTILGTKLAHLPPVIIGDNLRIYTLIRSSSLGGGQLLMDLADVGGNVKEGCHIASMGGTWMVMAYGAAGMRDYDGTLSFHPKPDLQRTGTLRFTLTYHGQRLVVKLAPDGATYSLEEGQQLTLRHYDETIILSSENRVMSRGYQEN